MQTVARMMPNSGIYADAPEEMVKPELSPYSRNMQVSDEVIGGRMGLVRKSAVQLNGPVRMERRFALNNGAEFFLVFTHKDAYSYDFDSDTFDILTPIYTTGTIAVTNGSATVTGSGTSWTSNLKAGDYIKLGTATPNTADTWYEIDSVDSDTQVTLTANYAGSNASGQAYTARQTFQTTSANAWSGADFFDDNYGETVLITNGLDPIMRWHGTGQFVVVAGLPTGLTSARFIDVYKNRVRIAWTVEGGNNLPQRDRWSNPGDCETWDDGDFSDLIDEPSWITGYTKIDDYHVVAKEDCAYVVRWVGGDDVFNHERVETFMGTKAGQSLVPVDRWVYYFGSDNKFHRWNIVNNEPLTEGLFSETRNFDPNLSLQIVGYFETVSRQVRWFCPKDSDSVFDYVLVYDVDRGIPEVWTYAEANACCSMGYYYATDDIYADDAIYGELYADEVEDYCDERRFLSGSPITVYGGWDGYIRLADTGTSDDGEVYERILRLLRDNFGEAEYEKRLYAQQWWLNAAPSGSVTLSIKRDDSLAFDVGTKSISLVDAAKDVIKYNVKWNKYAQNFQFQLSANNHFELLGYLSQISKQRRKTL